MKPSFDYKEISTFANGIVVYNPRTAHNDIPEIKHIIDNLDHSINYLLANKDGQFSWDKIKQLHINHIKHIMIEHKKYFDTPTTITDPEFHYSLMSVNKRGFDLIYESIKNINIIHDIEEAIIYRNIEIEYNQLCKYDILNQYNELKTYYDSINVNIEVLLMQYIIKLYILYNETKHYTFITEYKNKSTTEQIKDTEYISNLGLFAYKDLEHLYVESISKMSEINNNFIKYCIYIIDMLKLAESSKMSKNVVTSTAYKYLKYKNKYLEVL